MVVILLFVRFIFLCNRPITLCSSLFSFLSFFLFFLAGVRRPHLSKFYLERVQKARLYTNKTFHSLVSFQRLATWGLGLKPSAEAIAHELTVRRRKSSLPSFLFFFYSLLKWLTSFFLGMETMKENKGKEVVDEAIRQGVQSQPRPAVGDKRKNLSKAIDLENLPSCHKEKRAWHRSSKAGVVKPSLLVLPTQPSVQIHDVDF